MSATTDTTIKVYAHFTYKGDAIWQVEFPGEARPTYATGVLAYSNASAAKTNGPVVLETNGGMYTDQPYRDAIVTAKLASHAGMTLVTAAPLSEDERALFDAAKAAGFVVSEYVG